LCCCCRRLLGLGSTREVVRRAVVRDAATLVVVTPTSRMNARQPTVDQVTHGRATRRCGPGGVLARVQSSARSGRGGRTCPRRICPGRFVAPARRESLPPATSTHPSGWISHPWATRPDGLSASTPHASTHGRDAERREPDASPHRRAGSVYTALPMGRARRVSVVPGRLLARSISHRGTPRNGGARPPACPSSCRSAAR
jgi:hypothetical protein